MTDDERADPWSVTAKEIRDQLRSLRRADRAAAVATVADVEGSAYRRPGAKMVIPAEGDAAGSVTAGCLEGSVRDLASAVIASGEAQLEVYDLMEDDGESWGLGLGCNGIIDLFVEPLDGGWDRPLDLLAGGEAVTVATVVASDGDHASGSRIVITGDETVHEVTDRPHIPEEVVEAVEAAVGPLAAVGETRTVTVDGARVLVDPLAPIPELLLVGSQNDVSSVAGIGATAGFEVVVHAHRGTVDESTFPRADAVTTGHPADVADHVDADEHTYAVVMSHNLLDDRLALEALLRETEVPYVGLMGPRERFDEVRELLAEDDVELTRAELDRVSTPVGLDLGGGEPIQIALSIVGEVIAVSNDREGGRLRDREGPIHERTPPEREPPSG